MTTKARVKKLEEKAAGHETPTWGAFVRGEISPEAWRAWLALQPIIVDWTPAGEPMPEPEPGDLIINWDDCEVQE